MNTTNTTVARRCSGFARLATLAAFALLLGFATTSAAGSDGTNGNLNPTAALARLFNSSDHPMPVMPVAVPLAATDADVDALMTPGNHPTVFQISNATGEHANAVKVLFFQEMAVPYLNAVNFRKVAAGSAAAALSRATWRNPGFWRQRRPLTAKYLRRY
jgi:hypothetical protein